MIAKGKANSKKINGRNEAEIVCLEDLVPKFHLLRKIDRSVEWEKIYPMVENLYSANNGRPSVDPVVLVKMILLQHIYEIPSLKKTVENIRENMCCRWFLGYSLTEKIPHYSTISYNFLYRFTPELFEGIFTMVLNEAISGGHIRAEVIFLDAAQIKTSASRKKQMKAHVPEAVKQYGQQLYHEISKDREEHAGKPADAAGNGNESESGGAPGQTDL